MNPHIFPILAAGVLLTTTLSAQNFDDSKIKNLPGEVPGKTRKTNEVTVVLPPPEEEAEPADAIVRPASPAPAEKAPAEKQETTASVSPVLVTGKPPQNAHLIEADAIPPTTPGGVKKDDLVIRVEKIQTGQGTLDPKKVELASPFPPKPLGAPPPGWKLENPESIQPILREIELTPGAKIHLSIRPHVLVPETDGAASFNVREPGFDSSLGYGQTATVGAILSRSLRQMDEDSKQLGQVIDQLEQLVISLPKPQDPPRAEPVPPTTRKR